MANDEGDNNQPATYPPEQPHPSTKEHQKHWNQTITPVGPIGQLIESVLWHGMVVDDQLRVHQKGEPPLDIIKTPFQNLKSLSLRAAARARTRAEWARQTGNVMSNECREIDQDISQVDKSLTECDKGFLRTSLMGSSMHKAAIAGFNQDVDKTCSYCMGPDGSTDHVRWECKHFQSKRVEVDKDLACIPLHYLPMNIRSGVAPAMRHDGKATFWGRKINDDIDEKTKRLLGQDLELHKGGKNADETANKEAARELLEDPENKGLNARQVVLKYKQAHGSGVDLDYPTKQESDTHMAKN